jgi:hypothetical protein
MRKVISSALLVAVLATAAHADSSAELFQEGVKLLDSGDAAGACAKFQAALEARPGAPGVLLNLGLCNLKQNKLATALTWFREAQLRAAERGQTETENAAKQQTTKLVARVPTIKLEPSAPLPPEALVLIDGATVARTSFARIEIDAGRHTIVVSGPGLERTERTIDVADKPTLVPIAITVRKADATSTPIVRTVQPVRVPERPEGGNGGGHRGLAIGLAVTGAAALGVGGFFLWDAGYLADQRDKALAACTLARPCSGDLLEDYDRRGKRANTLAVVGFAAGGLAIAASAVLFLLDTGSSSSSVAITPMEGGAFVSGARTW